jgi:hypothetical protein
MASRKSGGYRDDYAEYTRCASDIAMLRVGGRIWEVAWERRRQDDTAVLIAATDSGAVCTFHSAWQPPTLEMLSGGEPQAASIYGEILLGTPKIAPSVGLDTKAVEANTVGTEGWQGHTLGPLSWRLDLAGDGRPVTLVQIEWAYGGGRGCSLTILDVVRDGRVAHSISDWEWPMETAPAMPMSPALQKLITEVSCEQLVETPVLGKDGHTYILFENTAPPYGPGRLNGVRLLAVVRDGMLQPMARLAWQMRNEVVPAAERSGSVADTTDRDE